MNRGHGGEAILAGDEDKKKFLELLGIMTVRHRLRLFAYCLMDNHYHLVLQNASGRLSAFFRALNTHYALYYRKLHGGKGYVFQGRFSSTLIADDEYLKMAILYVMQNPVRAGMVSDARHYPWSSAAEHDRRIANDWLDRQFVLDLFGGRRGISTALAGENRADLPLRRTPLGPVLGEEAFMAKALERFDRRKKPDGVKKRRRDDYDFDPVEKVIWEFERKNRIQIEDLDTHALSGKRLRAELLLWLKDRSGLTFREISEFDLFADLQSASLKQLYLNARTIRAVR